MDPQVKWDMCKIKIKELCIAYCKEKQISERNDMQMPQTAHNDIIVDGGPLTLLKTNSYSSEKK